MQIASPPAVPSPEPPGATVPPLRPPAHRVSPRAVRWWRLQSLILVAVLLAPQLVALVVLGDDPPAVLFATALATLLIGAGYVAIMPTWRYRVHRWEVTPQAVYTLSGWVNREWRIAPISRIQTVDTEHGPLQQLLKLASVTVTTASARGPVTIDGLDAADAVELARTLTETTQATPGDAT
ncbi:PH domain-containing protein [Pseudonocardia acidicola]|uniref:PH domain-containing protein n=1 Tax=Pseudonocardia acidicola TaxID=2724939 RepID=A0ABX1SGA1_9PSEU|nr:PH domain-containing protein [Pseudonocardia acidicola]NMI00597.1 PH domain-containing protein [Pseudonocardia acidicola]